MLTQIFAGVGLFTAIGYMIYIIVNANRNKVVSYHDEIKEVIIVDKETIERVYHNGIPDTKYCLKCKVNINNKDEIISSLVDNNTYQKTNVNDRITATLRQQSRKNGKTDYVIIFG